MRDAFREGDCWFNTGDVMSPQGKFHAAFVDRLGDTFRWKGENVATTQVEAALSSDAAIEECTVYGVEIPDTGGRAGMAAVKLREGGRSTASRWPARCTTNCLPTRCRYSCASWIRWSTHDVQEPQGGVA